MRKPISRPMHALLDFATVGFALAFPRLLGCRRDFTNAVTCLALGKLGYTLLTQHEAGIVKLLPMKAHLALDAAGGAALCALPFACDEDDPAAIACSVGMGLFDIAAAPMTETHEPITSTEPDSRVLDHAREAMRRGAEEVTLSSSRR